MIYKSNRKINYIHTDVLIIGGGTAGCYAAHILAKEHPQMSILIVDKAPIERSGCLAAGVNALNACITGDKTVSDYVAYAKEDGAGIVDEASLQTMCQELPYIVSELDELGLVFLRDKEGHYVSRGWRNLKINGENIKPLLANAARQHENISVLEQAYVIDLITSSKGTHKRVIGAIAQAVDSFTTFVIQATATLCATGGASGLYKPNRTSVSHHTMWYSPFNTGAGYAMGLRAGAELTSLEMRFVALRCKDTLAPTGTLAQGVRANQINALGNFYQTHYGNTTYQRVFGVTSEGQAGRGPCYLETKGLSKQVADDLYKAYLNMSPMQVLKWWESGQGPHQKNVEVVGSEPYIVGGHTASGYIISPDRKTTLAGLWAAGDCAGGCPQKYVTGCLAEGKLAAQSMGAYVERHMNKKENIRTSLGKEKIKEEDSLLLQDLMNKDVTDALTAIVSEQETLLYNEDSLYSLKELEEAMQALMDEKAGGISQNYQYTKMQLIEAQKGLNRLDDLLQKLSLKTPYEYLKYYELKNRLLLSRALCKHLLRRKETRWPGYGQYREYPAKDSALDQWAVHSKMEASMILTYMVPLKENSNT